MQVLSVRFVTIVMLVGASRKGTLTGRRVATSCYIRFTTVSDIGTEMVRSVVIS